MIAVIDYGMGNLRSVQKALEKLGHDARLVTTSEEMDKAEKVILPGVGAFGDAMRGLHERGLVEPIRAYVRQGRPLMGICLGMQIFMETSEEDPGVEGLGLLKGSVRRFRNVGLKIPHMGWNQLDRLNAGSRLFSTLAPESYVYFVHSYFVVPEDLSARATLTTYGETFVSAVEKDNLCGTQFHPEKSQETGLRILANFACCF